MLAAALFLCTVTSIYDGDGPIHCRERDPIGKPIKIRLSGIAAREMSGRCNANQPCPKASAQAAKAALTRLVSRKTLKCRQTGTSYSRVVATCLVEGVDVSCAMVRTGTVLRWARYDPTGRLIGCAN